MRDQNKEIEIISNRSQGWVNECRSGKYQYLMRESPWKEAYNDMFTNSDGIGGRLNQFQYSEQILDLQDRLFKRLFVLAKEYCTDRQFTVLSLLLDGYNQIEIGNILNIEQSTIAKTINGVGLYGKNKPFRYIGEDCNSRTKPSAKKYGGFVKKLRAVADKDQEIQSILKDIYDLRNEIL